jgi:hypothetical protein
MESTGLGAKAGWNGSLGGTGQEPEVRRLLFDRTKQAFTQVVDYLLYRDIFHNLGNTVPKTGKFQTQRDVVWGSAPSSRNRLHALILT